MRCFSLRRWRGPATPWRCGARLDGLHAAAIAAAGSLVLYLPAYWLIAGARVFRAPLSDIALQAVVQGALTAIVALLLYGRMVALLGATRGAAFVALTPAMTALLAIPVLGEWPSPVDWAAIALISLGVYVVSGGPLAPLRLSARTGDAAKPRWPAMSVTPPSPDPTGVLRASRCKGDSTR